MAIVAMHRSVQEYAMRVLAKSVQKFQQAREAGIEVFALVWRFIALDILHLLDSSAASNANPLPHPK